MRFYKGIGSLIGKTPLLCIEGENNNKILLKIEFNNPTGSVKDRAASFMLHGARKDGLIDKGARLVEPTSGNTGIALAALCSLNDYKITLVMPSSMSIERQKLLKFFGADLVLTDKEGGMNASIEKAREMVCKKEVDFMPDQFSNKYNLIAHYETTGPEIYDDMEGEIDYFVSGVGTGGTITGTGKYLKEKNSDIKIIAVEPEESQVLMGKKPSPHLIQGIGAGFIPDLLDTSLIDEVIAVPGQKAIEYSRKIAKESGVLCGISSGAALSAAFTISKRTKNKNIIAILPSTGERYLSTKLFQ